ncbi:MAG TPA: hypothetical protein VNT58_00515 [Gaiellaceae bacterium]|nr:hypothetical protein [Gaiellaceae bacterium]
MDWAEAIERATARYEDGATRLPDEADARQRQLTRMGNAAYAAGLCALMAGRDGDAREWLARAAARYRESWEDAPPGSWGRPVAILKSRVLAGDERELREAALWTLQQDAAAGESPIAKYAAALSLLVLEDWEHARLHADDLRTHDGFPAAVGDALAYIAAEDVLGYIDAVETVLESFEARDEYLEDVPVADTVLVLQALAARRDMAAHDLSSPLLPR